MTDNQTFAWIFLSVPRDGGALKDIIALTGAGSQLLLRLSGPGRTMMEIWDMVADELAKLDGDAVPPEDFTLDETNQAYNA